LVVAFSGVPASPSCCTSTRRLASAFHHTSTFCCTPLVRLVVTLPGASTLPSRRDSAREAGCGAGSWGRGARAATSTVWIAWLGMSATCCPDSQMSALLANISLSWQHKTDPDTIFLVMDCRHSPLSSFTCRQTPPLLPSPSTAAAVKKEDGQKMSLP
jgi:hypothetical protein